MYTTNVFQPGDLSAVEWQLLQLLATYADSFTVDHILTEQHTEIATESDVQNFYRHFHRLKNCGYIEVVPAANKDNDTTPHSYKLTPEGLKATSPKEKPVYPMRSLASRKTRHPNSFYLK